MITKMFYKEISRRFPEISKDIFDGDKELPYVLMGHLVYWLKGMSAKQITPTIVERLKDFEKWCCEQPISKNANDDLFTILHVGFYEKLFGAEITRSLLPNFILKKDLINNEDYLRQWVGSENYEKALKYYK